MSREPEQQPSVNRPLVGDSGNVASPISLSETWRSQIPDYAQDDMDIFQNMVDKVMPGAAIDVGIRTGFRSTDDGEFRGAGDAYTVTAQRRDADGRSQFLQLSWVDTTLTTFSAPGVLTPVDQRPQMTSDWRVLYTDRQYAPGEAPPVVPFSAPNTWDAPGPRSQMRQPTQIAEWDSLFLNSGLGLHAPEGSVADRLSDAIRVNNVLSPHF